MDIHAENILDHFKHPRRAGSLSAPSVTHAEKNLSCGDHVSLQLAIEGSVIRDVAWTGEGCAISQAGMSLLADELVGKTLGEAKAITPDTMQALLGVPVGTRRLKCALLGLHALKNALRAHAGEPPQPWRETVGKEGN